MNYRNLLEQYFQRLSGLPCWNVRQGWASCITFEFGQPHLETREPTPNSLSQNLQRRNVVVRGEYHLWIEQCDWHIMMGTELLAHSESEDQNIVRACRNFDGQSLQSIHLIPESGECTFEFEYDTVLHMKRYPDYNPDDEVDYEGSDIWSLFSENEHLCCTYNASCQLTYVRDDNPYPVLIY